MPPPSLSFAIIAWSLLLHRALILTLPFFRHAVLHAPIVNAVCGLLSDVFLGAGFYLVWAAAEKVQPPRRLLMAAQWVLVLTLLAFLASHLRYVEHFGMTLRPFHVTSLKVGEVWGAGSLMVFESWRAAMLLIAGPALGLLWVIFGPKRLHATRTWPRFAWAIGIMAVTNAALIQLRHHPDVNKELRYNALTAAYVNNRDYGMILGLPKPSIDNLRRLRALLGGKRSYDEANPEMPLWQKRLATSDTPMPIHRALKDTIAQGTEPWNVVLVIAESLRAQELHAFGNNEAPYATLTPQIDRLAADGVRFTEAMSVGLRTHYGQTAALCSLFGADDFSILAFAPSANAVCLPDIFADRGYETFFFYPADNSFDNQSTFYQVHNVQHIFGEQHFAPTTAKGGWGYSDHALYNFAAETLSQAKKPFFATVLTLTNHIPYALPSDAPSGLIDPQLSINDQLVRYVDWSLGGFYDVIRQRFPRTIFVVVADHGLPRGDPAPPTPLDPAYIRRTARIPWIIVVPDAPQETRGVAIDKLVSNVDVAPTLMSLLGWEDLPQQFMGEVAFERQGPVYLDWNLTLLELKQPTPGKLHVKQVGQDLEDVLGAVGRFNLLAPARNH